MSQEIAQRLAELTVNTRLSDLSPGAIVSAKQLALKTVAGMLVGSTMPSGKKIAAFIKADPDGAAAGVIGCDFRASLWKASFANAFFAHQSELEDDRLNTGTSWDITTFPMLFPLAEKHELSGAQMLEASVVGLEVMARTCQFYPQGYLGLSIVPPSVGPAALAARVLNLNAAQTAAAFGLAMSGVPISYVNFGTDAHYFETSLQTLNGLMAAQAAALGLSSNPDLLLYLTNLLGKDRVNVDDLVGNLGKVWQFREIWIKKYPCCFYNHRYIDGLLDIVRKEDIKYEQIRSIAAHVAAGAQEICNRPAPKTIGDLQFSFQHALASAAMDRDVNYKHIAEDRIADSRSAQGRAKVSVIVHPEWVAKLPLGTPARLELGLNDGRQFSSERAYPTGTLEEPLTLDEVKALFHKFVGEVLPDARKRFIADALSRLEELSKSEVKQLLGALVKQGS
jgi:2-methylcitrate dehydratase PrpD